MVHELVIQVGFGLGPGLKIGYSYNLIFLINVLIMETVQVIFNKVYLYFMKWCCSGLIWMVTSVVGKFSLK